MTQIYTTAELSDMMRRGAEHLRQMAAQMDFPWSPAESDPRTLHNMYVRNLIVCYVSKFSELTETVLESVKTKRFLVYALAGRSMMESAATLKYYIHFQYRPLLDKGALTFDDMRELIRIDDRHLRGSRFDWASFFTKDFTRLKSDTVKLMMNKRAKVKHPEDGAVAEQVNVFTCIEKWAIKTPEVMVVYNLFCDLVHPNVGSSLLVASIKQGGLYFDPLKGNSIGAEVFDQTLALLLSVTHKPFADDLLFLMATMWADDEIEGSKAS